MVIKIFGQVTLTGDYNPSIGDILQPVDCDTNGINPGSPGGNQTWDFTALIRQDSVLVSYVSPSATPYSAQFPTSNVALTNPGPNIFEFYTVSSSSLLHDGTGFPSNSIIFSDPEVVMQYPFTYNGTFHDNFYGANLAGGTMHYTIGTVDALGDAWGTINLPFGTFTNALRVKKTSSIKDSSNTGIPHVSIQNEIIYSWYVPGRKFPVFVIVYFTGIVNGNTQLFSKSVNYNSNSPLIGITPINNKIVTDYRLSQNYPNPFNPSTKIQIDVLKSTTVRLDVYDELGRKVETLLNQELKNGSYEVNWDTSLYSSGIYYYKLLAGDYTQTKKMVLIK
jgi:hypothetical protein